MTGATALILTADDDSTADLVADALEARGGKAVRIDVGDFPMNLSITGAIRTDGIWRGELIAANGAALDLESVNAVYYRRPTRFRLPSHLSAADRRFAEAEAHRGLGGLLMALPTRWVSHPARIADAEAKPVQLRMAAACGFQLPRTLISNDPDRCGDSPPQSPAPRSTSRCHRESCASQTAYAQSTPPVSRPMTLTPGWIRLRSV